MVCAPSLRPPAHLWDALRADAAHGVGADIIYYTLNESKGGTAISADEWGLIVGRHLLSPSEITLVKE